MSTRSSLQMLWAAELLVPCQRYHLNGICSQNFSQSSATTRRGENQITAASLGFQLINLSIESITISSPEPGCQHLGRSLEAELVPPCPGVGFAFLLFLFAVGSGRLMTVRALMDPITWAAASLNTWTRSSLRGIVRNSPRFSSYIC